MNPYGISTRPTIDVVAITNWTAANDYAREDYHRGYVINPNCDKCTAVSTCGDCKYKARRLLKVATSEDECAELLAIIDRSSPFAAKCGTTSGAYAHRQRGEEACRHCKDADNAESRRRYQGQREGAV